MSNHKELVLKFQNKNEKAFEELYHMYSSSIHGVIFNIVRNKTIADELMQDTFIKAWSNAETYSLKKGRFFTWILNIARNTAIDELRSKSHKLSKKNINLDIHENLATCHDNIDKRTDAIGLLKFLPKLSAKQYKIIDLLFLQGFTQKEASKQLDIPLGTVKTRSRNGILHIRNMIL